MSVVLVILVMIIVLVLIKKKKQEKLSSDNLDINQMGKKDISHQHIWITKSGSCLTLTPESLSSPNLFPNAEDKYLQVDVHNSSSSTTSSTQTLDNSDVSCEKDRSVGDLLHE